ncbi:hypothetical protein ACLK19_26995 [Escherichia coli]
MCDCEDTNPCGVTMGNSILDAYNRAYKTDQPPHWAASLPLTASWMRSAPAIIPRQFVEVIIAPSASEEALKIPAAKQNVRVLTCGRWGERVPGLDFKHVNGGLLVQDRNLGMVGAEDCASSPTSADRTGTARCAVLLESGEIRKCNAIVYAKNNMTIGIGAGQIQPRVLRENRQY